MAVINPTFIGAPIIAPVAVNGSVDVFHPVVSVDGAGFTGVDRFSLEGSSGPTLSLLMNSLPPEIKAIVEQLASASEQTVVLRQEQIIINRQSNIDPDCYYIRAQGWLRDFSLEHTSALYDSGKGPKYVLYPAFGYDGDSVVSGFPRAEHYIVVDQHPLIIDAGLASQGMHITPDASSIHTDYNDAVVDQGNVDYKCFENNGNLPLILGRLASTYPKVEFLGAIAFINNPDEIPPPYDSRYAVPNIDAHGVIFFRTAPGEPVKTMTYINAHLKRLPLRLDGSKALDLNFIDGLFVKGANGGLYDAGNIVGTIRKNHGAIIEGRANVSQFTPLACEFEFTPNLTANTEDVYVAFNGSLNISYKRGAKITIFR